MIRGIRRALRRPSSRIVPAPALEIPTLDLGVVEQEVPRIVRLGTEEDGEPVKTSCGSCCGLFRRKPIAIVPKAVHKNPLASVFRRKVKVQTQLTSILRHSCSVKVSRAQTDLHKLPDREPEENDSTVGAEAAEVETGPSEEGDVKDEANDLEEVVREPLRDASSGEAADEKEETPAVMDAEDEAALKDDAMALEELVQEPLMAAASSGSATDEKDETPAVMNAEDDEASMTDDSIETIQLEDGVPAIELEADAPEDPIRRPSPRIAWAAKDAVRYVKPRKKAQVKPTKKDPMPKPRQERDMVDCFRFCCLFPFITCFNF